MILHGGVRTARKLTTSGLIDEYQLVVHPVLLGSGLSIFESLENGHALELVSIEDLTSGVISLVHRPIVRRPARRGRSSTSRVARAIRRTT